MGEKGQKKAVSYITKQNEKAVIRFKSEKLIIGEKYTDQALLGRFVLNDAGT